MVDGLVSIGEMARRLGVSVATLRRWDREGRLRPVLRTPGGHRRYGEVSAAGERPDRTVCYARVSCADQRDDLERQKVRLAAHAAAQGWPEVEGIADLGSGMNHKKRGLLRLLGLVLNGAVRRVVVDAPAERNFEGDLARDVLEIITVFSARLYGSRSAARRRRTAAASTGVPVTA
jgi:putative resolvase